MRLTEDQEKIFDQIESLLLKMKIGETKSIKQDHAGYKNFMAICNFIRYHEWDVKENYYLIISPDEIRKESLDAYEYIKKLETKLNQKQS